MHRDIRLVLIVFLNFVYSVSLIGVIFFYSLMGTVATDRIGIIITEATGFQRQEMLLSATLLPAELHTLFWLSLAGVGFCLLFVYLLVHTFRSFHGPAALTVIVVLLMFVVRNLVFSFIPAESAQLGSNAYILSILARALQANIAVLVFGVILFCLAHWGDAVYTRKT